MPEVFAQVSPIEDDGRTGLPVLEALGPLEDVIGELARTLHCELRVKPEAALDVTIYRTVSRG